jgi:GNAT superfamily N-acetyltransferase
MDTISTSRTPDWPADLSGGAVRLSMRSLHYDATIAFYRDVIGLPLVAEFSSSFGEDGAILGLPDTSVHLEILRERSRDDSAIGHDEIVLYLDGDEAVSAATSGLRGAGVTPDVENHPYWAANGAVTYRDPDGRALVFAPWVFGRVPDPVDRPDGWHVPEAGDESGRIDWYHGDRHGLRALFEEAEDSAVQLDRYLDEGRVLVARSEDEVLGHLQLVETSRAGEIELKSMAVTAARRGTGIGTRLVEEAMRSSRASGYTRMVVATAAADIANLRFYQRRGFRFDGVEPDAFGAEAGYADGIMIDGIPLRDRVWLAQVLTS